MKLLVVTPYLPWPPDSGGKAALLATLQALPGHYTLRLVYSKRDSTAYLHSLELEKLLPNLRIIFLHPNDCCGQPSAVSEPPVRHIPPLPSRAINKLRRAYQRLITITRNNGDTVDTPLVNQPTVSEMQKHPWFPFYPLDHDLVSAIETHAAWADIIQFEFHDFICAGSLPITDKPVVFVCHQVHSQYIETWFSCRESLRNTMWARHHIHLTKSLETLMLNQFRAIIALCDEDKHFMESMGVRSRVSVCSFPYPSDHQLIKPSTLSSDEWKNELVFLGAGGHGPNLDGLLWFFLSVYPQIIANLGEEQTPPPVFVAGSWSNDQISRFQEYQPIFLGFVDDIAATLKGRISISPIHIGSGIRTKLLSAAVSASPIVTTGLGCQGLGFQHDYHCLIGDTGQDFANQLTRLLNADGSFRARLATQAFNHVTSTFSQEAVGATRTAFYSTLLKASDSQ